MGKAALQQIDFALTDIMGEKHTFSLIPLKTKIAQHILHNILIVILEPLAGAIRGGSDDDQVLSEVVKGLKALTFDEFWFMAERIFSFAVVDGSEAQKLEDALWYKKDPTLLYKATWEGIRGNFPDVFQFLGLDLSGFFTGPKPKPVKINGDTPDPGSTIPSPDM